MADRVLPGVRLIFPCREAVYDLASDWWELSSPWLVVLYPPGVHGNFEVSQFWVYAQMGDGVGTFDLHIEMRFLPENGPPDVIGRSIPTRLEFPGGQQLLLFDTAFDMRNMPFDEPGDYEFAVMANYVRLPGLTSKLRVLDLGNRI
jgi:hypothetical protein